jgi:sirohydrochlorin ferrochelatase
VSRKAILLVDHGSVIEEANRMLEGVADLVRTKGAGYHVEHAHMELAEPTIADGFRACVDAGARDVTVHPYMLSPGRHSTGDIPRMVAEAARAHPGVTWRVTEPLGLHELIALVVLERVRQAEANDHPGGAGR